MAIDIETEVKPILQKLVSCLHKDENGSYDPGFLESYKWITEYGKSCMKDFVREMQRKVDEKYFYAFNNQIREEDRETYREMAGNFYRYAIGDFVFPTGGKELPEHFDYLERIDCYEQLYDSLEDFHGACCTLNLDRKTSPSFTKCVRILCAFGDSYNWNNERLMLALATYFKKLRDICLRAASAQFDAELEPATPVQAPEPEAEEEQPAPAPQVEEKPVKGKPKKKSWSSESIKLFQWMDPILAQKVDKKYHLVDKYGKVQKVDSQFKVAKYGLAKYSNGELKQPASAVREWRDWKKAGRPTQ